MRSLSLIALFLLAGVVAAACVYAASARVQDPPSDKSSNPTSMTTTKPKTPAYSKSAYDVTPLTPPQIDQLAAKLSKEDAQIILAKGTERAFCGNLLDNHKDGVYVCKLCGLPLFSSDAKFNSGTGWPSFFRPFDPDHVAVHTDRSYGMVRDEILCARCTAHLGHVFDDGPAPTGKRFCLNSASLTFYEKGQELPAESRPIAVQTAYFAGGCFWGVEDRFQQTPGVVDAVSGYMGGKLDKPTYQQVCEHNTGHAETVRITFDPSRISYRELLEKFFKYHDPTQLNRQGPDEGDQYRSAIFTANDEQTKLAKDFIQEQQKTDRFKSRKIVTVVETTQDAGKFWEAEAYHQDYHAKHGGHCALPTE